MAYGSCRGMRRYVNRVFELEKRLGGMSDSRVDPTVPLPPIMKTWIWAFMRRTASTEQIGNLLKDARWRKRVGLTDEDGGSPDTAARALDTLKLEEIQEQAVDLFLVARREGLLKDDGPFGHRGLIVDMNELFCSESIHCADCQVREKEVVRNGEKQKVKEYYHQAVALIWASGELPWVIGWEMLHPGEGELPAALRLLDRLLPRVRRSANWVMGDALYCCRPFYQLVHAHGLEGLAISSGVTEMDGDIELLMKTEPGRMTPAQVAVWEYESEAWVKDVKCKLRVIHCERRYAAKSYKHERRSLRLITTAPVEVLPAGQAWRVGRCRWWIENGTFNILTRDYQLTHNYRHTPTAIAVLLFLRSLAQCLVQLYRRFATARSQDAPKTGVEWFRLVLQDDWTRYLDTAWAEPAHLPALDGG